jgi:hypothetical protein
MKHRASGAFLRLTWMIIVMGLCACATDPMRTRLPSPEDKPPSLPSTQDGQHVVSVHEIQNQLGLNRSPQDLGFAEKKFDGCTLGHRDDRACGQRFLSVVHFRLLCRDSMGTVQTVVRNLEPLVADTMQWRLAGSRGNTHTDSEGFGQVQLISQKPNKGKRFILIIGKKSLGLEVGEVNQIILPSDWCSYQVGLN